MDAGILFQNADSTVILIDIPRSIESAQDTHPTTRRVLSSAPPVKPYPSVEPKSAKAKASLAPLSLDELLLQKHLEFALHETKIGYEGDWCLPRIIEKFPPDECVPKKKRKTAERASEDLSQEDKISEGQKNGLETLDQNGYLYANPNPEILSIHIPGEENSIWIPPHAKFINGDISNTITTFKSSAPLFNLIVLDPPWPNRSARRKKDYSISYDSNSIRTLLSSIPLYDHTKDDGLIAIWITNKEVLRGMVVGPGGLFEEWGVCLVEEWIWIKTTSKGEPICALDSSWRKPYEILLVGRRGAGREEGVKRRIVVGVPDLHSRKPNLKELFENSIQKCEIQDENKGEGTYEALEIFARNLTTGWWSWGNEVSKFQNEECWVVEQ